ncbi:unnamed protein product, partial [marine sediment metagenome]
MPSTPGIIKMTVRIRSINTFLDQLLLPSRARIASAVGLMGMAHDTFPV